MMVYSDVGVFEIGFVVESCKVMGMAVTPRESHGFASETCGNITGMELSVKGVTRGWNWLSVVMPHCGSQPRLERTEVFEQKS